jgi:hypothetical protein
MERENKPDMMDFMGDKNASAIKVPDLDWLALSATDVKNIPVPLNIEIVPQLQENWKSFNDSNLNLIANTIKSEEIPSSDKVTPETIRDVVYAAKKDMMKGITGKALAQKLASTYPKNLIKAAGEDLKKLANEQGLLGNVYIDLTPFDSCSEAARVLGAGKIKLARYVTGNPRGHMCSSHTTGYCKELRKNVVASMEYSEELLKSYTTHLRIAGMIGPNDVIDSKDLLRTVLLRSAEDKKPSALVDPTVDKFSFTTVEADSMMDDFTNLLIKEASQVEKNPELTRFMEVRPVLAFIQDEMLKGKIGGDLKESINHKFTPDIIEKYSSEIKRIASLQGLLGNVYVDISYYKDADDAIKAIKTAAVNPSYLIQSYSKGKFDDILRKVALNTGCEILPRDGKISNKVASSYIDDLQFNQRISSDKADYSRRRIEAGDNVLSVLRDVFLNTISYTPRTREGGVKAHFYQEPAKKYAHRDKLKEAVYKAVEAGLPIESIENKLIQHIPTAEAVSIVRNVIASVKEIDANVLTKCAVEKYQFSPDVSLKKAKKCDDCIMCSTAGCTKHGLIFAKDKSNKEDKKENTKQDKPKANIDTKTEKVLLEENPDLTQMNIRKEFDMPDYLGSNINVSLEKMRGQNKLSMDISFNTEGLDDNLKNL